MSGPLVEAIGWALLHLLWQGVLVAAILAATLALLHRQGANARYLASCGALLLLVVLGVATTYRVYDSAVGPAILPVSASEIAGATPINDPTTALQSVSDVIGRDAIPSLVSFAHTHLSQIVVIWLAGVFILSVRLVIGWIGAH